MRMREWISQFRRYLRWQPFDTRTPEGRADERYRLALMAVVANLANRSIGMLVLLAGVSLSFPYLGAERFGIWMTVASLSVTLSFLDLGIGNAMVAVVAQAAASPQRDALAGLITQGMVLLVGIGLFAGALLLPLAWHVPLPLLFKKLSVGSVDETRQLLVLFMALFALGVPALAVQKIYAGLQLAWLSNAVMSCAGLLSLALIAIVTRAHASPPLLLLVTLGVQTAVPLVFLLPDLWRRGLLLPHLVRGGLRVTAALLLRRGSLYFVLQLGVLAGWGADSLLVSSQLAVAEVARLTIVQRMFDIVVQPLAVLNVPLWAAYADASARRDHSFIAQTLRRSMLFTGVVAGAGVIILTTTYEPIIAIWLRDPPTIGALLVFVSGLWAALQALGNSAAMYLNGCHIVKPQLTVVGPFVAASLLLKWLLLPRIGLVAIPLATLLSYMVFNIVPYLTIFRKVVTQPLQSDPSYPPRSL